MSKEENKIVEEINEDERVIEPEVVEEVNEPVVDDVKEFAPVVKAPLRDIQTPSMIHKHLDNFLAMLCGETPVDDDVRNSTEYWLKRLATGEGGGSTKKIYCHPMFLSDGGVNVNLQMLIFDTNPDAYTILTLKTKIDALVEAGAIIQVTGWYKKSGTVYLPYNVRKPASSRLLYYVTSSGFASDDFDTIYASVTSVVDGVNAIN